MCFRPADADVAGPRPCPHCKKMVFPSDGILPKKCPFCREELTGAASASSQPPAAPKAVSAPATPKAPDAPAVPGVPPLS